MARSAQSFGPAAILSTFPELRGEPAALALLDLIGRKEAPGGYNQRFGEKPQGPFGTNLIGMTVDQVLALRPRHIKGRNYSAAGRYQILKATLRDIKAGMGLSGSEKFDPEMQDRMAFWLLDDKRGYSRWKRGELTDVQFGNRIAMEWASFPVLVRTQGQNLTVSRGQSYYAGDGINKAYVKPEEVEAALAARSAQPDDPGPEPESPDESPVAPTEKNNNPLAVVGALVAGAALWGLRKPIGGLFHMAFREDGTTRVLGFLGLAAIVGGIAALVVWAL